MLRMPKRCAMPGSASVSSFASRTCGVSRAAACSQAGAMARQGPHHGAQKSTATGRSLDPTCRSKLAPSSAIGWPAKSGALQLPQVA